MSRALIIGGGVIGLCCAYYLRRRGFEVTVLDPAEGPRTSEINAGMIVPSHIVPLASPGMVTYGLRMMLRPRSPFGMSLRPSRDLVRWGLLFSRACRADHVERARPILAALGTASRAEYLELERDVGGFEVHQKGLVMIARREETLHEELRVAEQVRAVGLPALELDGTTLASFDPSIAIEGVGGVHYPADAHLYPGSFLIALRRQLEGQRVEFARGRAEAMRIGAGGLAGVEDHPADVLVLAAGVWSGCIARQSGLDLPLMAGKGYSFDAPVEGASPSIPAILMEDRVAVTPMPGATRFGGTMEIGPPNVGISSRRVEGIRRAIPRAYPALAGRDLTSLPVSVGLRPCTPDGLPYLGRASRIPNLIVATGHAMMGLSLAPITGLLVAQIASEEAPSIPLDLLKPERFVRA